MALDHPISRRQLLKSGAAGAAAAATLATIGPTVALGAGKAKLIPEDKVGTITFTQRDVPGRVGIAASAAAGAAPTMGNLGGDDIFTNPNSQGPLVPLPGGWKELFEFFASVGIQQVEFAGYGQNAANPGGAAPNPAPGGVFNPTNAAAYLVYGQTLRGFLDDSGLEAIGNHGFIPNTWPGGPNGGMTDNDFNRYMTELEFASILGMPYMGTGNDPTNATTMRTKEAWDLAGQKWEALNTLSIGEFGIQLYPHNHSPAYNFLQDGPDVVVTQDRLTGNPIPPTTVRGESGKRMMEYYLEITDPDLCVIELDIFWAHVAQHQHRWYYDYSGNRVQDILDPLALVAGQPKRFALYHAKDGDRVENAPLTDNGYIFVPFGDASSDIDFETFFREQGAKGFHNPNYEQDNAPGGGSDPGRSLRFTKFSANNMVNLRG
jgi:TAT (twin-arginine translocation) pathway signal sequence